MYPRLLPLTLLVCALLFPVVARGVPPRRDDEAEDAADPQRDAAAAAAVAVKQQVRALVKEAGQLMDQGDRAGAVSRLQQAQHLRPDPSLDYNLGMVYAEWNKAPEAASALSRFLAGATQPQVTRDRIDDARRRLEAYQQQLVRLSVNVPPSATQAGLPPPACFVDNQFVGPAPLAKLWLSPGSHTLRVSASSARDYHVTLALAPGEERTVIADLTPVSMQVAQAPGAGLVPPDLMLQGIHPPVPLYQKWWFWTAMGSGAVVVAALIGSAAAGRFNRLPPGTDLDPVDVAR